tara:strand:- start:1281 stop:1859 length:579 start_codon:yes stop_codon:yes gene_type:complete
VENRYASREDFDNLIAIPPFVNAINSDGDLMAVPNPAYDDARYSEERWREAGRREMNTTLRNEDNSPPSEVIDGNPVGYTWNEAVDMWERVQQTPISEGEASLPRYGSSRQPSTPPNINYIIGDEIQEILESRPPSNYEGAIYERTITESTTWHNPATPTPHPPTEEEGIEYERRMADTILQETEKIRNTPF